MWLHLGIAFVSGMLFGVFNFLRERALQPVQAPAADPLRN